ncbi:methyltransferase family protein [Sediminibacterium sp.]|uniref:methyltransferase family protein n=1 Tax=Sediminibacterium sp. TaxID=1917865 RepID=UPI003F72C29A
MEKLAAYTIVLLQFSAIGWLLFSAYPLYLNITAFVLSAIAVMLVSWALWVMRVSKIRVLPIPHIEAELVTNGPYRYIRHPMYTAVLLLTAGLSLEHFHWYKLLVWFILLIVLVTKLNWEEKMLVQKFQHYSSYQANSYKLIPFIY